jgi:sugar O-acyltransferase (sialic acid O-acetyltransferase NeuD family)
MKELVILGAGDFARIACVYFSSDSRYRVAAFTVDDQYVTADSLLGRPVIPYSYIRERYSPETHDMFVAIGFKRLNRARAEAYARAKASGYNLATYVSSKTSHCGEWSVGDNCFILEQNVIQPFVQIGNNVVLWSGNHLGHDAVIDDHVFISSHVVLSGRTHVGAYCFVGVNACVKQGVSIAPGCLIGAGAVILKNTKAGGLYAVKGTVMSPVSADKVEGLL